MFVEYIQASLRHAKYEILEDGTYISTVDGLQGVIAIGDSIEECRQDLIEVIEGWIALRLRMGDTIPSIDGVTIDVSAEPIAVVQTPSDLQARSLSEGPESWDSRDLIRNRAGLI